jgi:hypothetical protein
MILLNSSQKRLVSRTKYYAIDINLANEKIVVNLSNEESRIGFTNLKTILGKKIPKTFIPCFKSLLKPHRAPYRVYIRDKDILDLQSLVVALHRLPP